MDPNIHVAVDADIMRIDGIELDDPEVADYVRSWTPEARADAVTEALWVGVLTMGRIEATTARLRLVLTVAARLVLRGLGHAQDLPQGSSAIRSRRSRSPSKPPILGGDDEQVVIDDAGVCDDPPLGGDLGDARSRERGGQEALVCSTDGDAAHAARCLAWHKKLLHIQYLHYLKESKYGN